MYWQLHRVKNKRNGVWFDLAEPTKIPDGPFLADRRQYYQMRSDLYRKEHVLMMWVLFPYIVGMLVLFLINVFYIKNAYIPIGLYAISVPVELWKTRLLNQYSAKRAYYDALARLADQFANNSYGSLRW